MPGRADRAKELFRQGFSCSQAVFTPFAVEKGLDEVTALKLSQVLGGGLAHLGLTCGAVTGALLALSLNFGRSKVEDKAAKELTYQLAARFVARFTEKFGSINCSDLIGCSLKTPQGLALATEHGLFQKYCSGFVEEAARIVEELIAEQENRE
ncbi:MAG: C-GCAxxG-C-C family protein [Candidatus Saccharicenans sp.]